MNLGQLIEYNIRNSFLEKSHTKCGGKTSSRLFSNKSKLNISLDQQCKSFMQFAFIVIQVVGNKVKGRISERVF